MKSEKEERWDPLRDFRIWNTVTSNAKPLHTRTSEIVKSEKEERWEP
jgi:hypothetical protein